MNKMDGCEWVGEDWDDTGEPLIPVINVSKVDLDDPRKKREPRQDNCKRKLCYSP